MSLVSSYLRRNEMTRTGQALFESSLNSLPLVARGKVRDIYRVDAQRLLILATDRISAFDVVLPDPIPGKGIVLTAISNFWFKRLESVSKNHLTGIDPTAVLADSRDHETVKDRAVVVHDLKALPVEAVVRGYLIGSGWKDYCKSRRVWASGLPPGLELAERLRQPIFTPSTKAAAGIARREHLDRGRRGPDRRGARAQGDATSRCSCMRAPPNTRASGASSSPTPSSSSGSTTTGELRVMDELLTPDSSRFWPADTYEVGSSPPSFDKQYVRDYLETLDWNKTAPGPSLPTVVMERTRAKYYEALHRLAGETLQ